MSNNKDMTAPVKSESLVGREFIITREYDAPRELVWQACTEARHLARWWGPRGFSAPVCQWDARPGNKIHVVMRAPNGTDYPMGGEFHEVAPPERLVTTTGALDAEGRLLFEIRHTLTLAERHGRTKLTMHSRVVRTTPGAGQYIGGFEAGMTQSLERLADVLKAGTEPLVVERIFDAPASQVWQALTQVEAMRRWFFELPDFQPNAGFEFKFAVEHEGFTYRHRCQITEVIPEKKIAYTWRYEDYEGESLVTFELVAEGGRTRLKLTHEGLETFPRLPAFQRGNFLQGWTFISGALKDYVERATADREIVVSRVFNAPRKLVWQAMTRPEHLVHWWGPRGFTTTIETMDVRPGGVWKHVLHGPDGANYPNESVFQEVAEPGRLVFTNGGRREGGPCVQFVATWTFESLAADQTEVTIRMVFPSRADRDFVVQEFGALEGAKETLERLGAQLEKMALAPA